MFTNVVKIIPAIPEFILTVSVLLSLVLGLFRQRRAKNLMMHVVFVTLLLLSVALSLSETNSEQFFWHGLFIHTTFLAYSKIILYVASALSIFCFFSLSEEYNLNEYEWIAIMMFAVIGGSVALSSNHFLIFFLGLELSNLSQYLLVAANRDNHNSGEAAVKFFTIGVIGTALILFGISLLYGFTGTNDFSSIYYFFETHVYNFDHAGAILGMFFIVVGVCFKLPVAPFHAWIPDVYQVTPGPVLAFMSTAPKIITIFCLLHLLTYPFHGIFTYLRYLFAGLSILSMVWGTLAAVRQTNLKRMIAYSSIASMGLLLIGPAMGSELGIESVAVFTIIYALDMLGIFTLLAIFEKKYKPIEHISDLTGIMQTNPMLGSFFCMFVLSLAGLPPLPGFFTKAYIILGGIGRSAYVLTVIALITTVISAAYYLNVLKHFVLNQSNVAIVPLSSSKRYLLKAMVVIILLTTFSCALFPSLILVPTRAMAASALFSR